MNPFAEEELPIARGGAPSNPFSDVPSTTQMRMKPRPKPGDAIREAGQLLGYAPDQDLTHGELAKLRDTATKLHEKQMEAWNEWQKPANPYSEARANPDYLNRQLGNKEEELRIRREGLEAKKPFLGAQADLAGARAGLSRAKTTTEGYRPGLMQTQGALNQARVGTEGARQGLYGAQSDLAGTRADEIGVESERRDKELLDHERRTRAYVQDLARRAQSDRSARKRAEYALKIRAVEAVTSDPAYKDAFWSSDRQDMLDQVVGNFEKNFGREAQEMERMAVLPTQKLMAYAKDTRLSPEYREMANQLLLERGSLGGGR